MPNTQNLPGIPARVTAVHKERYEIVCEHGMAHARLKTKEYYVDTQDFPCKFRSLSHTCTDI